jgi:hypothetical protein
MAPLGRRAPLLVEKSAALVFSQAAASGAVTAFMYPPSSAASKPAKPAYVVDYYQNPSQLTRSRVMELLKELFEIDLCCSTQTTPSSACGKLMVRLEARDTTFQSGSAGIFAYAKYAWLVMRGLWYLYRSSHGSP